MIINTPHRKISVEGNIGIDGNEIQCVMSSTYLGVTLDRNLTWKSHIQNVVNAITPKVGLIAQLRHYVPKAILMLLYNTLILPHITYCLEIWGNTYATSLQPILLLQKKIACLITFSDFHAHSDPLFRQLGILDIYKLCKLHT